jgi:hypothetical protein
MYNELHHITYGSVGIHDRYTDHLLLVTVLLVLSCKLNILPACHRVKGGSQIYQLSEETFAVIHSSLESNRKEMHNWFDLNSLFWHPSKVGFPWFPFSSSCFFFNLNGRLKWCPLCLAPEGGASLYRFQLIIFLSAIQNLVVLPNSWRSQDLLINFVQTFSRSPLSCQVWLLCFKAAIDSNLNIPFIICSEAGLHL